MHNLNVFGEGFADQDEQEEPGQAPAEPEQE